MLKLAKDLVVGDVIMEHPFVTWTVKTAPVDAFKTGRYSFEVTPSNTEYETSLSFKGDALLQVKG